MINEIYKKVKDICMSNYLVSRHISITTRCGKVIVKKYKKEMKPNVAERRAFLALSRHISKCIICNNVQ